VKLITAFAFTSLSRPGWRENDGELLLKENEDTFDGFLLSSRSRHHIGGGDDESVVAADFVNAPDYV
jgi:hypothetical protein